MRGGFPRARTYRWPLESKAMSAAAPIVIPAGTVTGLATATYSNSGAVCGTSSAGSDGRWDRATVQVSNIAIATAVNFILCLRAFGQRFGEFTNEFRVLQGNRATGSGRA